MNENTKAQIAKELTLEAIKANMIKVETDNIRNHEAIGQAIAATFNAIIDSVRC